jgi:glycine oxidase
VDVIIVGAGVIGCSIAYETAARGIPCTVVDDRPIAGGATHASAGMLAPYVEAHEAGPLLELGIRSLGLYDGWIHALRRESGLDVEYRRIGTLEVALDPQHAGELRASGDARDGVSRAWLDADTARRQHPALGPNNGAVFTQIHGYVDARQLTQAAAVSAERRGARFVRARVSRVAADRGRFVVETSSGPLQADRVVLAAGAWAGAIDVDGACVPPLRPVRGQLLHMGWRGRPLDTILWGPECYIVPRVDGTILVGATVEDVGFDEYATAAGVRDLLDAACDMMPEGWGATFLSARVGLRPATPDELPAIGFDSRVKGLLHASGHYRNGVLLAPLTAKLVADFLTNDDRGDASLAAIAPSRFDDRS